MPTNDRRRHDWRRGSKRQVAHRVSGGREVHVPVENVESRIRLAGLGILRSRHHDAVSLAVEA